MSLRFLAFLSFIILVFISSCREKIDKPKITSIFEDKGFFILNEGLFNSGTGTIDFYSHTKDSLFQNIFQTKNNFPLGNIVQSAYSLDKKYMYIVVNNANKVEIVRQNNFESLNRLENIQYPRYIESSYNKLYVSAWDNTVKVYNLGDSIHPQFKKSISCGIGPERMVKWNEKLFVLNQGGFSIDSTLTVIDTEMDEVIKTISVYPKPTAAVIDKNNKLWIMCSGKGWNGLTQEDDSPAHLVCLDPMTYEVLFDFTFPELSMHPIGLSIEEKGETLYYSYPEGIMTQEINSSILQMNTLFESENMIYGLYFDVENKEILASNPLNYNERGLIYRLSKEGEIVDSFRTGIIPGNFLINE